MANANTLEIEHRIQPIRSQRVMLDEDLALLYGVTTSALVQAVKRNALRFPSDFMFELNRSEWQHLKSQFVISSVAHGGRRKPPYAFTEQGVAMLSSVLKSRQAIAMNIEIMRAFVHLRDATIANQALHHKVDALERQADRICAQQSAFEQEVRPQILEIFEAIRQLLNARPSVTKRPMGFIDDKDKLS